MDSASDVTTRSGRVRPPTRADSDRPRGSRTLAEGFRGRTTSGAEPPPRPGKVGRARGSRGRNRPLESRRTPGPRLPHRYRRRALPGPDARRLLESPPERRGGTWWPCPPGRACSRDSPLPDIDGDKAHLRRVVRARKRAGPGRPRPEVTNYERTAAWAFSGSQILMCRVSGITNRQMRKRSAGTAMG